MTMAEALANLTAAAAAVEEQLGILSARIAELNAQASEGDNSQEIQVITAQLNKAVADNPAIKP